MKAPFFRSGYNYDRDAVSLETGIISVGESLTVQSDAEDADINTIVRRFGLTGQLPSNVRAPLSMDFTEIFDFQSAMNAVRAAEEAFAEMPWEVRKRFDNNPHEFVEFCTELSPDGTKLANLEEMRKLGLAVPEAPVVKKEEAAPAPPKT